MRRPERRQVELQALCLDDLLPPDHRGRLVWAFAEGLDLGPLYAAIKAVEDHAGHPPADPRMLMALWLNATTDGIGSARHLARLCEEHLAYRWLCGGVGVNAKALADFPIGHGGLLEALLIDSVAALMKSGVARLERVAQDGVRVRASAGAASFRRASTLKRCWREAAEPVASLKAELEADPGAADRRHQAARRRAAREREQRVSQALEAAEALAKGRAEPAGGGTKTDGRDGDDAGGGDAGGDATKTAKAPRVSTTDPEARVIKMADGGFAKLDDLIALAKAGVTSYVPVPRPRQAGRDRHLPLPKDPPELAAWRRRMGREEAQAIYRERAAAAELPNAQARNRGLLRFPVRGGKKARSIALWHAVAHNMTCIWRLQPV